MNLARRAIERLLELEAHTPVAAEDGVAALDALSANDNVSMVVLDLMMPRMDGVEFLKRIRKDGRWARLPVVVITLCHRDLRSRRPNRTGSWRTS